MLSHKYYGLHRVLFPINVFPQPAWSLNPNLPIDSTELLVDIVSLHIDSVSFTQLKQDTNLSIELMNQQIINIVRERGKMHNPVTGSGGMLIGRVKEVGTEFPDKTIQTGQMIATLVSLTLTPLHLEQITNIYLETGQVDAVDMLFICKCSICCTSN